MLDRILLPVALCGEKILRRGTAISLISFFSYRDFEHLPGLSLIDDTLALPQTGSFGVCLRVNRGDMIVWQNQ